MMNKATYRVIVLLLYALLFTAVVNGQHDSKLGGSRPGSANANVDGIYLSNFGLPVTQNTFQSAIDSASHTNKILWVDVDSFSLSFANGEQITIDSNLVIKSALAKRPIINIPQLHADGVQYNVFYKNNNIDVYFEHLDIRGDLHPGVKFTDTYTIDADTVTIGSSQFVAGDVNRYVYLDSATFVVPRLIIAYTSGTEVVISDGTSIDASGNAFWYRENSNRLFETGGSDIAVTQNIDYYTGQRYFTTSPALDQNHLKGFVYFTINTVDYERRIEKINSDTIFFSEAIPDTITTNATVSAKIGYWNEIVFKDCVITGGWRVGLSYNSNITGGDGSFTVEDCEIISGVSGITMFANVNSENVHVKLLNSRFYETGISKLGDGNEHPNDPNGAMVYLHEHLSVIADNLWFTGNDRVNIKTFSSSGVAGAAKYQTFSNCYFLGTSDNLSIYGNGPVATVSNCVGNGTLRLKRGTHVTNSDFDIIALNTPLQGAKFYFSNVNTFGIDEEFSTTHNDYEVYMNQVMIKPLSRANAIGLRIQTGTWVINDCEIHADGLNAIAVQMFGGSVRFNNCELFASHTSGNYTMFQVSGTALFNRTAVFESCTFNGTQTSISGNATYTTDITFRDCINESGQLRVFNALAESITIEGRVGTHATVETVGAAGELKLLKSFGHYNQDIAATDTVTSIVMSSPTYDFATTDAVMEYKLFCTTSVVFDSSATSLFDFEQAFSTGDVITIRWNDTDKTFNLVEIEGVGINGASWTGWAEYIDTSYRTTGLSITGGDTITIPNLGHIIDHSQLPLDLDSMFNRTDTTLMGIDGDGRIFSIEFDIEAASANTTRFEIWIDIGGSVRPLYGRTISLAKGNGVVQPFSFSYGGITKNTWESNGGKVKITANEDVEISGDIVYLITRTHKARQ